MHQKWKILPKNINLAVDTFLELQEAVTSATFTDRETSSPATQLLAAISTAKFQLLYYIMNSIQGIFLQLSRVL